MILSEQRWDHLCVFFGLGLCVIATHFHIRKSLGSCRSVGLQQENIWDFFVELFTETDFIHDPTSHHSVQYSCRTKALMQQQLCECTNATQSAYAETRAEKVYGTQCCALFLLCLTFSLAFFPEARESVLRVMKLVVFTHITVFSWYPFTSLAGACYRDGLWQAMAEAVAFSFSVLTCDG